MNGALHHCLPFTISPLSATLPLSLTLIYLSSVNIRSLPLHSSSTSHPSVQLQHSPSLALLLTPPFTSILPLHLWMAAVSGPSMPSPSPSPPPPSSLNALSLSLSFTSLLPLCLSLLPHSSSHSHPLSLSLPPSVPPLSPSPTVLLSLLCASSPSPLLCALLLSLTLSPSLCTFSLLSSVPAHPLLVLLPWLLSLSSPQPLSPPAWYHLLTASTASR